MCVFFLFHDFSKRKGKKSVLALNLNDYSLLCLLSHLLKPDTESEELGSWFQIWDLHFWNTFWCECNINYVCFDICRLQSRETYRFTKEPNSKQWLTEAWCQARSSLWDLTPEETCVLKKASQTQGRVRGSERGWQKGLSLTSTQPSTFNPPPTIDLVSSDDVAALHQYRWAKFFTERERQVGSKHASMTVSWFSRLVCMTCRWFGAIAHLCVIHWSKSKKAFMWWCVYIVHHWNCGSVVTFPSEIFLLLQQKKSGWSSKDKIMSHAI